MSGVNTEMQKNNSNTDALRKYIAKQSEIVSAKRAEASALQNKIDTFMDENRPMKRENFQSYLDKYAEVVSPLHAEQKKLHDTEDVAELKRRVAVKSYVEIIANVIRKEIKEGGKLYKVPCHFKKFSDFVKQTIEEYKIPNLSMYLDAEYGVYLQWRYADWSKDYCSLCRKENGQAVPYDGDPDFKIYTPSEIETAARAFLKEQKKFFDTVEALEKKAKELGENYRYFKPVHNGPSFIYGSHFLKRD